MTGPLRIGTVFPYTTLFRSQWQGPHQRRTHLLQASFERLPRSKRPVRESHFSHISIQQHDAVSPHALSRQQSLFWESYPRVRTVGQRGGPEPAPHVLAKPEVSRELPDQFHVLALFHVEFFREAKRLAVRRGNNIR